jgi:hypothetical protein
MGADRLACDCASAYRLNVLVYRAAAGRAAWIGAAAIQLSALPRNWTAAADAAVAMIALPPPFPLWMRACM